jgi:hypothetical protein
MENVMKALWEIFLDSGKEAGEKAIQRHNDEVEGFYDGAYLSGQMSYYQAQGWKEYSKR